MPDGRVLGVSNTARSPTGQPAADQVIIILNGQQALDAKIPH